MYTYIAVFMSLSVAAALKPPPFRGFPFPTARFNIIMGLSGAALGPNLDNYHSAFGVLKYEDPVRLYLPNGLGGGDPLLTTASWVPPMFGSAGLIIGGLYVVLDDALVTTDDKRKPSWPKIWVTISAFTFQYWLSGYLFSSGVDDNSIMAVMTALAALGFCVFDNSLSGLVVSAATALGGPLIEFFLINFKGQYHYAHTDFVGSYPLWILPVYALGGPAVGNLARGVRELVGEGGGGAAEISVCGVCKNSRVNPCPNCDGFGFYESYSSQVKCNCCKGSGQTICRTCFGETGIDPNDLDGVREFMKRRPD